MTTIIIPQELAGQRIDKAVCVCLPELARAFVQKLIEQGQILSDGKAVSKSYKPRAGEMLTVLQSEPCEIEAKPEDIPLDVRYEDDDLLVVNKPRGMVVHPAPGNPDGTLVNALLYHCRGQLSGINGVLRPGIVHRIDRDTSGLLMIAKNDAAHQSLAAQLKEHSVTRRYTAIVQGCLAEDEGTVDRPIGRDRKNRLRMAVDRDGKRAVTHYRVLERFSRYTLVECRLETGRTHQIRVHMASLGHPLLGDVLYGAAPVKWAADGQCLHARLLGFVHPRSGEYLEFESELPDHMRKIIEKLRNEK